MPRFLIDVNLPYRFALWSGDDCIHMRDVGETWTDTQIWEHGRRHDLAIVSKDADFSDRAVVRTVGCGEERTASIVDGCLDSLVPKLRLGTGSGSSASTVPRSVARRSWAHILRNVFAHLGVPDIVSVPAHRPIKPLYVP